MFEVSESLKLNCVLYPLFRAFDLLEEIKNLDLLKSEYVHSATTAVMLRSLFSIVFSIARESRDLSA